MEHALRSVKVMLTAVVMMATAVGVAERPSFDKTPLKGLVMTHANPWFPVSMAPKYDLGGPNVPYHPYHGDKPWEEMLKTVAGYGINAVYLELCAPNGHPEVYRAMLEAAQKLGDMKIAVYFTLHSRDLETAIKGMKSTFNNVREELLHHPSVLRVEGRPLVLVYQSDDFTPLEWRRIIGEFEAEFGPAIFLLNYSNLVSRHGLEGFKERLESYLEEFDGVSTYVYSMEALSVQREEARVLKEVMAKNPGKFYQGSAAQGYAQHFNTAGVEVHLSRNWRESVRLWLSSEVDSIELTNLFDHYENTLIYPCYEREDLLLRYLQYELSKWKGAEFKREKAPELVLCNYTSVLAGWTPLDFEVLGFPIDADEKEVDVAVLLCDTDGKVIEKLGPKKLALDDFRSVQFSLKSSNYVKYRGVVPRLVYRWKGEIYKMPHNPMTLLSPSMRPHRLYWARSTRNHPGKEEKLLKTIVKRDGVEEAAIGGYVSPDPGKALHWHYSEKIYESGKRVQSLPVWEVTESALKQVKLPICLEDGSIREIEVESARVPSFYWPVNEDNGRLLVDANGWEHNALTDGDGYGGGHLPYTGYNYCHAGKVEPKAGKLNLFRRDAEGRGYLRMSGENWVTAFGGTTMPGASTYELEFRPKNCGRLMGLFAGVWGKIDLAIMPDGRLSALRRSEQKSFTNDTFIVSKEKVEFGEWNHAAVVYDLKEMKLYLNGRLTASAACKPNHKIMPYGEVPNYDSHEFNTQLFIGSSLKAPFTPIDKFVGYIRNIRITGRNLSPDEFVVKASGRQTKVVKLPDAHLRFTVYNLCDQTDFHDELVYVDEWMSGGCEKSRSLRTNVFAYEDVLTGEGRVFLRLAPLPHARADPSQNDFIVDCLKRELTIVDNGYPVVEIATSGGKVGRIKALQDYQRKLRPYVSGRDGLFLSNTWGDRNRDTRIYEDFLLKEIEAAADLGVEVIQVDDGWQTGKSMNSAKAQGKGAWNGYWSVSPDFWVPDTNRFPHGLGFVTARAKAKGLRFGLWYGPDSSNDCENWERDADWLLKLHRESGVDYFKLDSMKTTGMIALGRQQQLFDRLLEKSGGKIVIDMDVTAERRPGYFGMISSGPLFLENRYSDWKTYWPHLTLRALWSLSEVIDPIRLRIEVLNPLRNRELYGDDELAPAKYPAETLFAIAMTASPLGWFEAQNLALETISAWKPLIATWKRERDEMAACNVIPVGGRPDGMVWTGFAFIPRESSAPGYVLLFRELSDDADFAFNFADWFGKDCKLSILSKDGQANLSGVHCERKLSFVWVKVFG